MAFTYRDCRLAGDSHEYCSARYGGTEEEHEEYETDEAAFYSPSGGQAPGALGEGGTDRGAGGEEQDVMFGSGDDQGFETLEDWKTQKQRYEPDLAQSIVDFVSGSDVPDSSRSQGYYYDRETGLYRPGYYHYDAESGEDKEYGGTWQSALGRGEEFWDMASWKPSREQAKEWQADWQELTDEEARAYGDVSAYLNQRKEQALREQMGLGSDYALEEARRLAKMASGEHEPSAWETDLRTAVADGIETMYGGLSFAGEDRNKQARALAHAIEQQDANIQEHISKGRAREAELAGDDLASYLNMARNQGLAAYQAQELQAAQFAAQQQAANRDDTAAILSAIGTAASIAIAIYTGIPA